jgi:hypothetical protein
MSVYLQGIDNAEIIDTVHSRRAPMISASAGLRAPRWPRRPAAAKAASRRAVVVLAMRPERQWRGCRHSVKRRWRLPPLHRCVWPAWGSTRRRDRGLCC